ncbi:hypothetical protein GCM10023238_04250 [Streptomyces heliomycini]
MGAVRRTGGPPASTSLGRALGWAPADGLQLGVYRFSPAARPVHINAGGRRAQGPWWIGKRIGFKKGPIGPHSLPLVMLRRPRCCGFGWFGSTPAPGSANDDGVGALMFATPQVAHRPPAVLAGAPT